MADEVRKFEAAAAGLEGARLQPRPPRSEAGGPAGQPAGAGEALQPLVVNHVPRSLVERLIGMLKES
ncbi:MAG: hypothetical protein ACKOC5_08880 [Chloroflexota bacterium]